MTPMYQYFRNWSVDEKEVAEATSRFWEQRPPRSHFKQPKNSSFAIKLPLSLEVYYKFKQLENCGLS